VWETAFNIILDLKTLPHSNHSWSVLNLEVRKSLEESKDSALYGLYCDGLVSELFGSNEMSESSAGRDGRTPN